MTTTEPIQGGPSPEPSDSPDGPNQLAAITAWAAGRLWMRFASPSARDVQITSPVEGMHCTTGTGATQIDWAYRGGQWRNITTPHAWQSYTPALTGFTLGNGTIVGEYTRLADGTVHCGGRLTFGSTSSITGTLSIGLPVSVNGVYNNVLTVLGDMMLYDTSAGAMQLWHAQVASGASFLGRNDAGGSVAAASPWTWASGDQIMWNLTYRGVLT